jgi:ubiquinone/menaquinone biosynthesis C-methylase UbiE
VLEVGVGTGMNLGRYKFASQGGGGLVESVVGIDLSKGMLDEAGAKAAKLQLPMGKDLTLRLMDVEKLEFQDATFDTVVDTYGLCVFSDPVKAVRAWPPKHEFPVRAWRFRVWGLCASMI